MAQHQDILSLRHKKIYIWYPVKKETVHQFYVGYMTYPFLKKHRTRRDQVIKMFQSTFKLVTLNSIKNELSKKNVSVLSFMMFYDKRKQFTYKVIGSVIYTIIHEYIFVDYLGLLQEKLSKNDDNFKNTKFNYLYGLGIPDIMMNIMSCNVMDLLSLQYQQLY